MQTMKTLSQAMRAALDVYTPKSFMCHVVEGSDINGAIHIAEEMQRELKQRILDAMPGENIALCGYLYDTDATYQSVAKRVARKLTAIGGYTFPRDSKVMCSPECFRLRCDFWKAFIADLEAEGL